MPSSWWRLGCRRCQLVVVHTVAFFGAPISLVATKNQQVEKPITTKTKKSWVFLGRFYVFCGLNYLMEVWIYFWSLFWEIWVEAHWKRMMVITVFLGKTTHGGPSRIHEYSGPIFSETQAWKIHNKGIWSMIPLPHFESGLLRGYTKPPKTRSTLLNGLTNHGY